MSNFILNLRQVHLTPTGPSYPRHRPPSTRTQTVVFASPTSYVSNVVGNLGAPLRGAGFDTEDTLVSLDPMAIDVQGVGVSSISGERKTAVIVISKGEEKENKLLVYSYVPALRIHISLNLSTFFAQSGRQR